MTNGSLFDIYYLVGNYYFYDLFDSLSAIFWLKKAVYICENSKSVHLQEAIAQPLVGLALAYHNIGNGIERDLHLNRAKQLLEIPDDISNYKGDFKPASAAYFVVRGYKSYIDFENSERKSESLFIQELYLLEGQKYFNKALEITVYEGNLSIEQTHALQGLGTLNEFLGKCKLKTQNRKEARELFKSSNHYFRTALDLRISLFGEDHLEVARTHHKLARSLVLLRDICNVEIGIGSLEDIQNFEANEHYKKALSIFQKQNFLPDTPS